MNEILKLSKIIQPCADSRCASSVCHSPPRFNIILYYTYNLKSCSPPTADWHGYVHMVEWTFEYYIFEYLNTFRRTRPCLPAFTTPRTGPHTLADVMEQRSRFTVSSNCSGTANGPRLATLEHDNIRVDTPAFMFYTKVSVPCVRTRFDDLYLFIIITIFFLFAIQSGSVPHVSREVFEKIIPNNQVLFNFPLPSCMNFYEPLKEFKQGLNKFVGLEVGLCSALAASVIWTVFFCCKISLCNWNVYIPMKNNCWFSELFIMLFGYRLCCGHSKRL